MPIDSRIRVYDGPECPHCHSYLTRDWLHSGVITCPDCTKSFEATYFQPPQRKIHVASVAASLTPDGANACANHARNAATTNCQRCGLFICALCDMNVGSGSYCPNCFDRLRNDNALAEATTRYRDYASMARIAMVVGLFFSFMGIGFVFGIVSLFYSRRGMKQLRAEGRSTVGLLIVILFAIGEIIFSLTFGAFLIYTLVKAPR